MKTPIVLEQSQGGEDGFAHVYAVELLFETAPRPARAELLDALRRRCGTVEDIGAPEESRPLHFAHPDHRVTYTNRVLPVQTLVHLLPSGSGSEAIEKALQQSWDWPEARSVVSRCRSAMLVTDLMAAGLSYRERLALFHRVVLAVLDVAPAEAIHWRSSQRVVDPGNYASLKRQADPDVIYPAINVRLFNVANRAEGDTVMDSLGLAALGIPDVQCHFRDFDPTAVAAVLHNSAAYLFEHGDVIADGHTIQGLTADQRWRCRHEDAIVGPARIVLDLDPGPPHAAGDR